MLLVCLFTGIQIIMSKAKTKSMCAPFSLLLGQFLGYAFKNKLPCLFIAHGFLSSTHLTVFLAFALNLMQTGLICIASISIDLCFMYVQNDRLWRKQLLNFDIAKFECFSFSVQTLTPRQKL